MTALLRYYLNQSYSGIKQVADDNLVFQQEITHMQQRPTAAVQMLCLLAPQLWPTQQLRVDYY